ncbi:MAG: acyl-CoA thioesterase [Oligoflexia bacterium]|nr:acyl-CoA thioesterase [Oligoflexia bacterium]
MSASKSCNLRSQKKLDLTRYSLAGIGDSDSNSSSNSAGVIVKDKINGHVYHQISSRVLYIHTDCSGVVYHAHYLMYFEMARAAIMRTCGHPYAKVEESGIYCPIIDTSLSYLRPLKYDQLFFIHIRPAALERATMRFDYVISDEDQNIYCRGHTTHCTVNRQFRPIQVDISFKEIYEKFSLS